MIKKKLKNKKTLKKLKKVEKPEDLVKWLGQVSLCQVIYFKKEKLEKKLACLLEKSEKNPQIW